MVMQKVTPQLCFEMTTNFLAIASIIDTDRSDDNKAAQDVCDLIMAAIKLEPAKAKKPDLHLVKDDAG